MDQKKLKIILFSGCKFEYDSYDHKEALKEYHSNPKYERDLKFMKNPSCFNIPLELKDKFKVTRIGKLWSIEFNKNGDIYRVKIGHKYQKNFYIDDFGKTVRPILKMMNYDSN